MVLANLNVEPYEKQYIDILKHILRNGKQELNTRTGIETIRVPHALFSIDLEEEFPILKCKKVLWKSSLKEIMWIMQLQSNNINSLGAHIWDDWADDYGSIGKAYGYQAGKSFVMNDETYESQVHYVLKTLATDKSSRRAMIDLWNVDDLNEMNLVPCCYSSIWNVIDGRLNCMLVQRSADYLVGVPFNTTQYAILTHLFARHLGLRPGVLTHVMADCHVYGYDSHLEGAKKMIQNYESFDSLNDLDDSEMEALDTPETTLNCWKSVPTLKIDGTTTDFFSMNIDDIHLDNYHFMENLKFDVAV